MVGWLCLQKGVFFFWFELSTFNVFFCLIGYTFWLPKSVFFFFFYELSLWVFFDEILEIAMFTTQQSPSA